MKCSAKELTSHASAGVGWNHALTFQRIHLITIHVKLRIFISSFLVTASVLFCVLFYVYIFICHEERRLGDVILLLPAVLS
jgi:hypothetical protein